MVGNDLVKELEKIGIDSKRVDDNTIEFIRDGESVELKVSTIRKVFLNSLITYIDNIIE